MRSTLLRRLTALFVLLALAAPAAAICGGAGALASMAGMPCCEHETPVSSTGVAGADCCQVQPGSPAGSPAAATLVPAPQRHTSPVMASTTRPVALLAPDASWIRRAEAHASFRPHTAPHLLDTVLLI